MLKKIGKMLKKQEGFTLVELMVAVVILGILAGIGVQQYARLQETAREKAHEANLRIIKSAAEMYYIVEGTYTENIEDLESKGYLEEVPKSPWDGAEPYKLELIKDDDGNVLGISVVGGEKPQQ